jgi:hypothetical protein
MGATFATWGPYGSHVHCTGAIWHHVRGRWCHMGLPCTAWEPNAPYGSRMHRMCAIWEPCVHYGMQRAPYGSCVQAMGAMFSGLHHIGATTWSRYDICEEDGPKMTHVPCDGELCALYGSHVCYMGAVCTIWELHMPHRSHMHHMGAACTA